MNKDKVSFAIKVTNWCNLKCAHCCENSGSRVAPNIMPLDKVERYVNEFNAMPVPRWQHLVFTGGEAMAPYFMRKNTYIPQCLDIAGRAKMFPFVKTNGMWGANETMRHTILQDCARAAEKNGRMVSLDISIDEFHKNVPEVASIILDIVGSRYLADCVRVSISGLNTEKSRDQLNYLIAFLKARGVEFFPTQDCIIMAKGVIGTKVICDFNTNIASMGRAASNKLGDAKPDGHPDVMGHCLQIDNDDIATLNYFHKTPVNGRTVYDVTRELLLRTR